MSYIGQGLPADVFSGFTTDTFAGDGSATTFTLSKAPFSEDGLIVVINNVIQKPTTNFTVSGTTLTIVGTAVASGDVIYAIHTSGAVPSTLASKVDVNGLSDGVILDADADTTISADTDDQIDFKAGGTDIMSLTATTATFNDGVEITTADNTDTLTLTSTDADANAGPNLRLYRNSGSPADSDLIGNLQFEGRNDNSQDVVYAEISSRANDVSDGTEDGLIFVKAMRAGTLTEFMRFDPGSGGIVVNDGSADIDFRVESDHLTSILHVNSGLTLSGQSGHGAVGIGKDPAILLDVEADLNNDIVAEFNNTDNASGGGGPYGIAVRFPNANRDGTAEYFYYATDSVGLKFAVYANGNVVNPNNSYGASSDSRIKQGIRDASSQWDDIKALKIRNYKKNEDVEKYGDKAWEQIGVIAQELEASGMDKLVDDEVLWDKDHKEVKNGEATEGDIKQYKSVKYSVLYMKAIKALQEAMEKIETLETKVKALEDA